MSTGILEKTNILVRLPSESKEEAIRRAAELLQKQGYVNENYHGLMLQRETECTTYIGNGVAIPHGISRSEKDILKSGIVVLQYPDGVSYNGQMAYLVIGIAGKNSEHLDILANIACLLDKQENVDHIVGCKTADEVYELLMPLNETEV